MQGALGERADRADRCLRSAALFAAGHDGGVEALAEAGGQVVDLVGAIDFDGLAGGVEGDFAVVAAARCCCSSARISGVTESSIRSSSRARNSVQVTFHLPILPVRLLRLFSLRK